MAGYEGEKTKIQPDAAEKGPILKAAMLLVAIDTDLSSAITVEERR